MKKVYPLGSLLLVLLLNFGSWAQTANELDPGYYVVVAAYAPSRAKEAQNYTEFLNRRGHKAQYGFNSNRNYYFVYVQYSKDLKSSLREMQKARQQDEFSRAWVRVIPGYLNLDKEEDRPIAQRALSQNTIPKQSEPAAHITESVVVPEAKVVTTTNTEQTPVYLADAEITDNPEIIQYERITLENTEVFLSLYNSTNNRIVEGTVKVIDSDRSKLIKEVKGNDYLYLPNPGNKSGMVTLICEAFGYRKVQQEINYPLPLADTAKSYIDLMGTTFIVNFDLVRYHKGDIATLFHVYFYNDAALMLPESKYELTSLLQMMQENPNYRVKLHGHTNGNYHGKIIKMGPDKNFFSLTGAVNSVGSAKDLSKARAESIKEYLTTNGVDPSRIEVKAWGGKRPIHDRHSANAKKNVRVEVEILAE